MIKFEEALDIVYNASLTLADEKVSIFNSLHRVLAEDVIADIDMPPFDKSAMDGYACRREDLYNRLTVLEIIPAGQTPTKKIGKNECSKIMTGAMIPDGADCVIMVEYTKELDENTIKFTEKTTTTNISYRAEDLKKGKIILKKGLFVKPQHIALLASVGYHSPKVYMQPKVAIIATGSELVDVNKIPGASQIRNSNGYQLVAQVVNSFAIPNYYGIARDSEEETETIINKAIYENEVVLITGGVSMGDYDFVPQILKRNNVKLLFEKIAIKPGKPTVFGIKENKFIFGLPGNPVSTFVLFELLVRPLIYKMMGTTFKTPLVKMPMGIDYVRRNDDRMAWIPIKLSEEGSVNFVDYHGSAHVHSLSFADGLVAVPIGTSRIEKGELVNVRLL